MGRESSSVVVVSKWDPKKTVSKCRLLRATEILCREIFEESKNAVVDAYIAAVKSLSSGSEDGLGKS